jgi:hypothetical protein
MAAPLVRVVSLSLFLCSSAASFAQDTSSFSDDGRPGFEAGDFEQRRTPFTRPGGPRVWAPRPAPAPIAAAPPPSGTTIVILQGASQQPYDGDGFSDGSFSYGSYYGGGAYYGGGPYYGGPYYGRGQAFHGFAPRYGARRLGPYAGLGSRSIGGARMGGASPRFGGRLGR